MARNTERNNGDVDNQGVCGLKWYRDKWIVGLCQYVLTGPRSSLVLFGRGDDEGLRGVDC